MRSPATNFTPALLLPNTAALLTVLLAACQPPQPDHPSTNPSAAERTMVPSPTVTDAARSISDPAADPSTASLVPVSGTVFDAGDIGGAAGAPYDRGMLIVVPNATFATKPPPGADPAKPFTTWTEVRAFTVELRARAGAVWVPLNTNGAYTVPLPPGDHLFGVGNLGASHPDPAAFPALVYGWTEVRIARGAGQRVDIFFEGDSGVTRAELKQ